MKGAATRLLLWGLTVLGADTMPALAQPARTARLSVTVADQTADRRGLWTAA